MKDEVKEEVKNILKEKGHIDEATNDDYFKYRNTAAKRIYEQLSDDEKAKIDEECESGNVISPVDIQQR